MSSPNSDQLLSDDEYEMIDNKCPTTKGLAVSLGELSVKAEMNFQEESTDGVRVEKDLCERNEITRLREEVAYKDDEINAFESALEFLEKKTDEMKETIDSKDAEILRLQTENELLRKNATDNVPCGARTIRFQKVDGKCGASHRGTSIDEVEKDGPAGQAGLLRGDQVISINGINVETLSCDTITKLSQDVSDDVTLVVRFNPERLIDLEKTEKRLEKLLDKKDQK